MRYDLLSLRLIDFVIAVWFRAHAWYSLMRLAHVKECHTVERVQLRVPSITVDVQHPVRVNTEACSQSRPGIQGTQRQF